MEQLLSLVSSPASSPSWGLGQSSLVCWRGINPISRGGMAILPSASSSLCLSGAALCLPAPLLLLACSQTFTPPGAFAVISFALAPRGCPTVMVCSRRSCGGLMCPWCRGMECSALTHTEPRASLGLLAGAGPHCLHSAPAAPVGPPAWLLVTGCPAVPKPQLACHLLQ